MKKMYTRKPLNTAMPLLLPMCTILSWIRWSITRPGSEWFWQTDKYGTPAHKPIVEPWKCPYRNGRMCMELMRRNPDVNV